jgi:hypothetical protein
MGLFKDLHKLNQQAKEISRDWDPAAQMRQGMASMQAATDMMAQQTTAAALATSGTAERATAQITAVHDTGIVINLQPVLQISLLVFRDGLPPYPAAVRQAAAMSALPRLVAGAMLAVDLDPEHPETVLVNTLS